MPRSPGTKNGEGVTVLAPIKNWKPWMTSIVIKHIAGLSHEMIASEFPSKKDPSKNISTARISQIINDPHGQQMIRGMEARLKEKMESEIENGLLSLAEKGVTRLAETLNEEFAPGGQAKKHQDDVALVLVKNFIPGEKEARAAKDTPPMSEKLATRFIEAMERSNEARRLNRGEVHSKDGEIVLEERIA